MLTKVQITELLAMLLCPITQSPMDDPVLATDGNIYERTAIEKWLQTNQKSPLTRAPMNASELIPNPGILQVTRILKSILESGDLDMDEEDENIEKRGRVAEKIREINSLIRGNQYPFTDRVSQQFVQKYNELVELNASVLDQIPKPTGFFPVNILAAFFSYNEKFGVRLDNLVTYLDGKPVSNDSPLYICVFKKDENMMEKLQGGEEEIKTRSVPLGTVREFIVRTSETNGEHGIRDVNNQPVYDPYNHEFTANKNGGYNMKNTLKRSYDPKYLSFIAWSPVPYVEKKKKAKLAGGGCRRTQRRYKKTKGKRQKSKRRNHKTRRNRR